MYQKFIQIISFVFAVKNMIISFFIKKPIFKEIPIVINNRNRLTFLVDLISFLERNNYTNIIIIDNNSSYKPLLDFYKTTKHKVIRLEQNLGYNSLEKIELYKKIRRNYFVYTDSDVVPIDECPSDFLEHFYNLLCKYPMFSKIGFSLRIDDLPDCYENKNKVIDWESQFYNKPLKHGLYDAAIDTTFALHRPYALISCRGIFKMGRTAFPYTSKHMPWYNDSKNLSIEEQYYVKTVEIGTHWSAGIEIQNNKLFIRLLKGLFK